MVSLKRLWLSTLGRRTNQLSPFVFIAVTSFALLCFTSSSSSSGKIVSKNNLPGDASDYPTRFSGARQKKARSNKWSNDRSISDEQKEKNQNMNDEHSLHRFKGPSSSKFVHESSSGPDKRRKLGSMRPSGLYQTNVREIMWLPAGESSSLQSPQAVRLSQEASLAFGFTTQRTTTRMPMYKKVLGPIASGDDPISMLKSFWNGEKGVNPGAFLGMLATIMKFRQQGIRDGIRDDWENGTQGKVPKGSRSKPSGGPSSNSLGTVNKDKAQLGSSSRGRFTSRGKVKLIPSSPSSSVITKMVHSEGGSARAPLRPDSSKISNRGDTSPEVSNANRGRQRNGAGVGSLLNSFLKTVGGEEGVDVMKTLQSFIQGTSSEVRGDGMLGALKVMQSFLGKDSYGGKDNGFLGSLVAGAGPAVLMAALSGTSGGQRSGTETGEESSGSLLSDLAPLLLKGVLKQVRGTSSHEKSRNRKQNRKQEAIRQVLSGHGPTPRQSLRTTLSSLTFKKANHPGEDHARILENTIKSSSRKSVNQSMRANAMTAHSRTHSPREGKGEIDTVTENMSSINSPEVSEPKRSSEGMTEVLGRQKSDLEGRRAGILLAKQIVKSTTDVAGNLGSSVAVVGTLASNGATTGSLAKSVADTRSLASSVADTRSLASNVADTRSLASNVADTRSLASNVADTRSLASNVADTSLASNVADTRSLASNVADTRSLASNVADTRSLTSNVADTRSLVSNVADTRSLASNVADTRSLASNVADTRSQASNVADTRSLTSNVADTRSLASNVADTRSLASNVADTRSLASNVADTRSQERNVADTRSLASNVADTRSLTSNVANTRNLASNVANTRSLASNVADTRSLASNVADTRSLASNVADTSLASNVADTRSLASNVADARSLTSNVADTRSLASNVADTRSLTSNVAETRSLASNVADTRSLASNVADTRSLTSNVADTGSQESNVTETRSLASNIEVTGTLLSNTAKSLARSVLEALPSSVRVPETNTTKDIWSLALKYVLGNPKDPSGRNSLFWTLLREVNGGGGGGRRPGSEEDSDGGVADPVISEFLKNPARADFVKDIRKLYDLLNDVQPLCRRTASVGGLYDWKKDVLTGDQVVCVDADIALKPDDCVVYSFRSRTDWVFEKDMENLGCQVWAFDPGQADGNHNRSSRIYAYSVGLSDRNETEVVNGKVGTMFTLSAIENHLGHLRKNIDVLRIDLNGKEWKVLQEITHNSAQLTNNLRQVSVHVHLQEALQDPSLYTRYCEILLGLRTLGFHLFASTPLQHNHLSYRDALLNEPVSLEYELTFLRI